MAEPAADRVPTRSEVRPEDTWDLSSLFASDVAWETTFADYESKIGGYSKFAGKLGNGPAVLAECLAFDTEMDRLADRIGTYAFLKTTEDVANSAYQGLKARYIGVASRAGELASYIRPELLSLPTEKLNAYVNAPEMAAYKLTLERVMRYQKHTLTQAEERLLAMQAEVTQTAHNVFDQLLNADLKFGTIELAEGKLLELSHGSYAACLENPDREIRRKAFTQYYREYEDHANTFAATLAGSVKQDVYHARVRNYPSAREAALFPDNVPVSVYDNLIAAVRANLPVVHRYYQLRRKLMNLPDIHFYDTYAPIIPDVSGHQPWDSAVDVVIESLKPLGSTYVDALVKGLRGRWCDRYENKGKHSGAFSSGCYDSEPYILMNYRADVPDHVFTLAHEAGHSMHSQFSKKTQPPQYANYTIFVAEVASTFNEQFLGRYLMKHVTDNRTRAYYLNREIDDLRRTIVRQTMFAEYEKITHELAEKNEPLTLESFREEYQKLLDAYFGPDFTLDEQLSLEGLRIPHFYRAFYVYKYATGLSAAIALAERVANGGKAELDAYLGFLKGGCSKDPLDLLRDAGVDMEQPEPVNQAFERFGRLVDELEKTMSEV
ncbi:oligoendopeptidase F [Zavarzinella formosa]|uniref:oligoendopeptidase F n=1 Tax=Zavarzinella formosa TaxID=360055 RepID=UPI0002D2B12B|nr:oligoendopeptidase F [Zavarzinella formosa]